MLRYVMTAAALKSFSASPQTKRMYRYLGNRFGQSRRIQNGVSEKYQDRARRILELCERYHAIQQGDKLLEVGTGWVHWEATVLRLFYDVEITLFDVWDNRQLGAYKQHFSQLEGIVDKKLAIDPNQRERAHRLLRDISMVNSFDEIYDVLGFRYVINPRGTLEQFQDDAFTAIFSCNVLEHIERGILPGYIQDFHRILKPGGHSIHQIDLGDHLAYYDRNASLKNYLRYSDNKWKWYFENDVQYFNRVQRPEWLHIFQEAGLEMVGEEIVYADIGAIKVHKSYESLCKQDLQCLLMRVVHRKPPLNT